MGLNKQLEYVTLGSIWEIQAFYLLIKYIYIFFFMIFYGLKDKSRKRSVCNKQ